MKRVYKKRERPTKSAVVRFRLDQTLLDDIKSYSPPGSLSRLARYLLTEWVSTQKASK